MKNILHISPVGVFPPKSGGSSRIYNLDLASSQYYNIYLFSQGIRRFEVKYPLKSWETHINKNYIEYRFINTLSLATSCILGRKNISNILSDFVLKVSKPSLLIDKIKSCHLIQVEQPWQFDFIYNKCEGRPLILVEQNIEFQLIQQLVKSNSINLNSILTEKIIDFVREKERYAIEKADVVFAMSIDERNILSDEFHINRQKIYVIPNGVDIRKFSISTDKEKIAAKAKYGFKNKKIAIFVGGMHTPNIEAVKNIIRISKTIKNKDIIYLIVGRVGENFKNQENVRFTGTIDDVAPYIKVADIALNPMISGSGTSLKMLEYLAAGIPVITTRVGARGLDIKNGKDAIISEVEDFPRHILSLLENSDLSKMLAENGRNLVQINYDWRKIAEKQMIIYEKLTW